jgi:hypothetical protein
MERGKPCCFLSGKHLTATHVGAAAGCDLLMMIVKKTDQKIAACGSSYMRMVVLRVVQQLFRFVSMIVM